MQEMDHMQKELLAEKERNLRQLQELSARWNQLQDSQNRVH